MDPEYPVASFRILETVKAPSPELKRVVFEIGLDRMLNGYAGSSLSLELPVALDGDELIAKVLACVNWTLTNRTGVPWPAANIVDATVRAVAPVADQAPPHDPSPLAEESGVMESSEPPASSDSETAPIEDGASVQPEV